MSPELNLKQSSSHSTKEHDELESKGSDEKIFKAAFATILPNGTVNKYRDVKHLKLVGLDLSEFPENFAEIFSNLCSLDLAKNKLQNFPLAICALQVLESLSLSQNEIKELPSSLEHMPCLRNLDLSKNKFSELSNVFFLPLTTLQTLNLSHNQLKKLPFSCSSLNQLVELDISHNQFRRLPNCVISGMNILNVLDVSSNPKIAIHHVPNSANLSRFVAKDNLICPLFPSWILFNTFKMLESVVLDRTEFTMYDVHHIDPVSMGIKHFSMRQSNLCSTLLPLILKNMPHLEVLDVGNDRQEGNIILSMELERNSKLKEIHYEFTGVAMLPSSIGNMKTVVKLDLSFNNISWFPKEFTNMKNLEILIIRRSQLISLPDDIDRLSKLREIHVENNCLCSLPDSLVKMDSLEVVDVYNNCLNTIPEEFHKMKLRALDLDQNYFNPLCLDVSFVQKTN